MRVVFDSNIFISALIIHGSRAEKAIVRIVNNQDILVLSKTIIDEVLSVLAKKFSRDREAISRVAVYLDELGDIVCPIKMLKIFRDDPDNRILECAVSGKADAIVTGDKEMLSLKEYKGIKIMTLRDYMEH
ncbi:MAG TPA: putative toxin-antitoxin system toxin component, PIN family [Nitrospirae bacterium]|nr:PIN domain protein [bacterium BMS3Abin06]HDH12688.1 putative toxin-antitoxin system toxin component, PIN family [Nitrospirota bacterium]HDY99996.1 putative toxin-antitoxin system toxin component, PIN family [Nitrospirota bacterium]